MDKLKQMYLFIEDADLIEKYLTIQGKVSADIKKELDREPVYNLKKLKTKRKSRGNEVTDFYDKEIFNMDSNDTCLAIISLESAIKKGDHYYPQI